MWTLADVCEELRSNWADIVCLLRFASGDGPLDTLDLTLRAEIGIPCFMWNLLYLNVSVVKSYEKSFGASSVRSCYWAVESASFIRELMSTLVDDDRLPAALDTRSWLFVDVESYAISEVKQQVLIESFRANNEVDASGCLYDEDMSRVPVFILTVVKNVSALPGVRDDLSFVRSVFSLPSLNIVPEDVLLAEIRVFTDLLVELGRISYAEQGHMERGFL